MLPGAATARQRNFGTALRGVLLPLDCGVDRRPDRGVLLPRGVCVPSFDSRMRPPNRTSTCIITRGGTVDRPWPSTVS